MDFDKLFSVETHYRSILVKVERCVLNQRIHLRACELMPYLLDIFSQDMEHFVPRFYEDIAFQRGKKHLKRSNKSFRTLMDNGFPFVFGNYRRALLEVYGGTLLKENSSSRHDFDLFEVECQKTYKIISERLFLQSKLCNNNVRVQKYTLLFSLGALLVSMASYFKI